jgi:hypothetical protein
MLLAVKYLAAMSGISQLLAKTLVLYRQAQANSPEI